MKKLKIFCFFFGLLLLVGLMIIPYKLAKADGSNYDTITGIILVPSGIIGGVMCGILASKVQRSMLFWPLAGFLAPMIACLFIPFLKVPHEPLKTVTKTCQSCHKPVSEYAVVGGVCPHCGVKWTHLDDSSRKKSEFWSFISRPI